MVDEKPARLLQIADPCPAAWDAMSGRDAQRHCGQCGKTVHHLSAMPPADAEELLAQGAPGGICVRVRCDSDGFVVHDTQSEPRSTRRRLRLLTPAVLAALAACNTRTEGDDLVVEGPSRGTVAAVPTREVAPTSAPTQPADAFERAPQAPSRRVAPEPEPDNHSFALEAPPKPPEPSFHMMGLTVAVDPPRPKLRPHKQTPSHQAPGDHHGRSDSDFEFGI